MVTDRQIRRMSMLVETGMPLAQAATRADLAVNTARKYRRLGRLPSEVRRPHTWRTRGDPFDGVWEWCRGQLELNPGLQAKTLFEALQRDHPGRFPERPPSQGFMGWLDYVKSVDDLPIRDVLNRFFIREESKTDGILGAYEAPFPDKAHKVGAHQFPLLVPLHHDDPGAAEMRKARDALGTWNKPALLMFGAKDLVLGIPAGKAMQQLIPTASELIVVEDAGHFIQEDAGEELAERILEFMDET